MVVNFIILIELTFPIKLRRSFRNLDDKMAATRTLRAPSGVTSDAGAKAYATKLSASPTPTGKIIKKCSFIRFTQETKVLNASSLD